MASTRSVAGVAKPLPAIALHWFMVLFACLCLFVSNGMVLSGLTAFDGAILAEYSDWSRGDLKLRGLITLLLTGILAPFIGIIIDRVGVRLIILFGSVMLSLAYFAYAHITHIYHIYLIHCAFAAVLVACGLNVAVILVSNWFVKMRGTAIGIAVVGTSLGGAVLSPLFGQWLADGMDWRVGFQTASMLPLVLTFTTLLLVKNTPAEAGLAPYGRGNHVDTAQPDLSCQGISYRQALATRCFWAIAIIAMLTFYAILGLQANLFLYLQDMGFATPAAAAGLTWLFIPALIGKFLFGMLADNFHGSRLLTANLLMMLLGFVALLYAQPPYVLLTIAFIGFAWGGFYTLLQLNAVNHFGLCASGKLLGTITVLDALGGGLGIFITGKLHDLTGSYQPALQLIILLLLLALCLSSQIPQRINDKQALRG